MTREEQLVFCKKCQNRKFDVKQGLVCGLTMEKATFQDVCPDFKLDETVKEEERQEPEAFHSSEVKQKLPADIYERLRMEQNLPMAASAGVVASLGGAILWALITVSTGYQIGYMAVAIGLMVGFAIRYTGKGLDPIFGIMGAALSLLGCVLGNILSIVGFVAQEYSLGYFEVLSQFDVQLVIDLMAKTFSPIDLLFYGIALYEGYHFAFRHFTDQDIIDLKNKYGVS